MNARPSDRLAIAVAQLNSTVGDIAGNAEKVRLARVTAAAQGATAAFEADRWTESTVCTL